MKRARYTRSTSQQTAAALLASGACAAYEAPGGQIMRCNLLLGVEIQEALELVHRAPLVAIRYLGPWDRR